MMKAPKVSAIENGETKIETEESRKIAEGKFDGNHNIA